jgi:carboxypeptidase C (cathepsin A)
MRSLHKVSCLAVFLGFLPAWCEPQNDDAAVTTQHQAVIDGNTLRYTAKAGLIPIRDNETGDIHANMFFVSYTLDRTKLVVPMETVLRRVARGQ